MARYDAYNSECLLFSFKDGLLARLAHDLKLQVERFSIEVDDTTHEIKATFDPSSIQVVCAQVDGRDDPSTLSKGDRKKIYDNVTKDVLRTRKHPEIRFDSTNIVERGDGFAVEGGWRPLGDRAQAPPAGFRHQAVLGGARRLEGEARRDRSGQRAATKLARL